LGHDHEEVGLLESQFLDFFLVVGGLALEDDLLRINRVPLLVLDLLLQVGDLNLRASTVWVGSISTENTSPFRFFILIFIVSLEKFINGQEFSA
jgi:hypothetical protein